jgi:hypothetical protein
MIRVIFKDGTIRDDFADHRPGGSWHAKVKYEGAFVIVIDAWGNTYAFPSADVKEVQNKDDSRGW